MSSNVIGCTKSNLTLNQMIFFSGESLELFYAKCKRTFYYCIIHILFLYIGWQWRNFFISYLCQLFFCHVVGQTLRSVSYSDITFLVT